MKESLRMVLNFINNNNPLTIGVVCCILVGYLFSLLNTPDAIIECPDGSSMVIDLPIDMLISDKDDLLKLYTIPVMCGDTE